ncbi:phosphotransferase [Spiroplasma endosymbiont of Panorpa germanica]|uniref:phosphotransferase n=1 Tax=Spiroplasma endosymbiont of Panorpa germanica TaxID=3066314 RepID=UPI0030CBF648
MKNVTFLELGLSNTTYLENGLFCKKSNFIVDDFLIRKNEAQVLKEISQISNDFLIKPVKFGFKNGLFISSYEYFPESPTLENLIINNEIISQIAMAIKSIHSINIENSKIKKFNFKKILDFFETQTQEIIFDLSEFRDRIITFLQNNKIQNYSLCHNDLVPGNFLFTTLGLKIIDYDFMHLNDPLFDLASFVSETLKEEPTNTRFFLKQFDLRIEEFKKITNYIFYQNYLWCYWGMYMFQRTKLQIYKNIAEEKFQQLKNTKFF